MQDNESRGALSWFRWNVEDAEIFRDTLTTEQMGELFFAVMQTVQTGELVSVSRELVFPYRSMCLKVRHARTAYKDKCEKLAANGSKGGRKKAENRKKATAEASEPRPEIDRYSEFKPPSLPEFEQIARSICTDEALTYDPETVKSLYESLVKLNWSLAGVPFKVMCDMQTVIFAQLSDNTHFERAFAEWWFKHEGGCEIDILKDFCYKAQTEPGVWNIHGEKYTDFELAVEKF